MHHRQADHRPMQRALAIMLGMAALSGSGTTLASTPLVPACEIVHAAREDVAMRVPFEVFDGRIYVQAQVNGRGPFRFAVDTGASGMARADTRLVSSLKLDVEAPATTSDGITRAQADTTTLDTLGVGALSRQNLHVITRDYSGHMPPAEAFDGILGRAFFGDGLLIIDYPRKTLSFSKKLSLSPLQKGTLHYDRAFRIPVRIGDISTEGNLDTGANVAFVLPEALFKKVGGTPLRQATHGHLTNSQIEISHSTLHGPIQFGGARLSDVEVTVSKRYPELLVGAHALDTFTLLIDQRSKSIALCP